jgi:hypothetical protein
MLEEIKKNKFKEKEFENASKMSSFERKISFLNRYFVYKKIREVNTEKVELEFGEYQETEIIRNSVETKEAIHVAEDEEQKNKPKIRKLSKKLLLVAATEAIDEKIPPVVVETKEKKERKKTPAKLKEEKPKKAKKLLIIEEDEE